VSPRAGPRAGPRQSLGDEGSSLLEVLVALAIAATVAAALSFGALGAIKMGGKAWAAARSSAQALRVDDCLRRVALGLRFPFWERALLPRWDGDAITLPYAGGRIDGVASIARKNGGMVVEAPGCHEDFPGVALLDAKPLIGRGVMAGIVIEYRVCGRSFRTAARFGAAALPSMDAIRDE
jgi:hypothetical protein